MRSSEIRGPCASPNLYSLSSLISSPARLQVHLQLFTVKLHVDEGKKRAIMNSGASSLLSKAAIPTRLSLSVRACQRPRLNDDFTSNISLRVSSVCHTKRLCRPRTIIAATCRTRSFLRRVSSNLVLCYHTGPPLTD
jgi:hypothetical protein